MMNSLDISNFKGFKKLTIPKLGRLNLIVGKNNSGKSSILEALMIYASGGSESILREISINHDEKYRNRSSYNEYGFDSVNDLELDLDRDLDFSLNEIYPYEHLFYGRKFNKNSISIGEIEQDSQLSISFNKRKKNSTSNQRELLDLLRKFDLNLHEQQIQSANVLEVKKGKFKHLISLDEPFRLSNMIESDEKSRMKFNYVKTSFESMDKLGFLWDKITLTDYEKITIKALKLIEPDITDLRFINKDNRRSRRTAIMRLNDGSIFPVRSMGDGIVRVMELILNLYSARDGYFLVDEFDNGLHFSVQKALWEIIFDLSKKLNIQVFATTHSWDCIQSFTEVAIENKDIDGVLLKIGKSKLSKNKGQSIVTIFDENKLNAVTQKMVEVR
ncbi:MULTISPECIES: AAA family ATPase [Morganellaceae]|nr:MULTISPECIES: ATP-binding protein [Morganellaceae]KLN95577.1 hypothetical protein VK86_14575 [Moellerella wisconsensis]